MIDPLPPSAAGFLSNPTCSGVDRSAARRAPGVFLFKLPRVRVLPDMSVDEPPTPAMDQPGVILALIGAAGLVVIAGAFFLGATVSLGLQPEAPAGAVNISPGAQQPTRNAEGELLPVQPGEPEEKEPVINATPPQHVAPPTDPAVSPTTAPPDMPDAAKRGEPTTHPAPPGK
jgi:hypothetical protein